LKIAPAVLGTGVSSAVHAHDGVLVVPAAIPVPGVIEVGKRKQLFLDDWLIASKTRVSKYMGRPERCAKNPLIVANKPWERENPGAVRLPLAGVQICGQTVIYDKEEQIFKMWYNPYAFFEGKVRPWCYAVSKDGYNWEKPNLGVYQYKGSRSNNILGAYLNSKYFNVFKDPRDPDPGRRYKAMGEVEGASKNGTAVAFSPDGLHWTEHPGNPVVPKGREIADCPTFLGWDTRIQKYVYYPRPGPPLATRVNAKGSYLLAQEVNPNVGQLRTIGYSTRDDFIHWSPTQLMLAPGESDRVDSQYYQMTAAQDEDFYVGLMHMLQTRDQSFDIYLLTSRDGFYWNWADRQLPFMKRGERGSYDFGYLTPSAPIVHDGQIWIYYGAYADVHSYEIPDYGSEGMTIALATLPVDRYLGLLAGMDVATVVTRPTVFAGSKLKIDMDSSLPDQYSHDRSKRHFDESDVRVALLDQWGGAIEGFGIQQCEMLTESGVQEVSWRGTGSDIGNLAGKPVRIRVEFCNACLYGFQFS
jgi:hypothetical protein